MSCSVVNGMLIVKNCVGNVKGVFTVDHISTLENNYFGFPVITMKNGEHWTIDEARLPEILEVLLKRDRSPAENTKEA